MYSMYIWFACILLGYKYVTVTAPLGNSCVLLLFHLSNLILLTGDDYCSDF